MVWQIRTNFPFVKLKFDGEFVQTLLPVSVETLVCIVFFSSQVIRGRKGYMVRASAET